ncbi:MAG TPA: CU044_2847 family protein [Ktedonobacteraceae bacterium]|nr:CU044_2847 family protein [Ktedonobacteraceae bacterium]
MKHLVEFPLEGGGSIIAMVDEPESEGTIRAGRGDTITKAKETLETALNKVLPATGLAIEKLRNLGSKPDEVEVTFGMSLSTVAGIIIASTSADANFSVTVHWSGGKEETTPHP